MTTLATVIERLLFNAKLYNSDAMS